MVSPIQAPSQICSVSAATLSAFRACPGTDYSPPSPNFSLESIRNCHLQINSSLPWRDVDVCIWRSHCNLIAGSPPDPGKWKSQHFLWKGGGGKNAHIFTVLLYVSGPERTFQKGETLIEYLVLYFVHAQQYSLFSHTHTHPHAWDYLGKKKPFALLLGSTSVISFWIFVFVSDTDVPLLAFSYDGKVVITACCVGRQSVLCNLQFCCLWKIAP